MKNLVWYWPLYDEIYIIQANISSHDCEHDEKVTLRWELFSITGLVYIGEFD